MKQTLTTLFTKIIEYSFYALFLLIPLVFTSTTSELFEFNKMWLTFGIAWIIAAAWISKMIVQKQFFIQKTPLDIPIGLFFLAYTIATLFSIDPHISFWGYYSRFNGGWYSIFTYIVLYYAFVTNFINSDNHTNKVVVMRSLIISLVSATIVALWGFPSHFGYDPTCLLFRGTFDVSCWTEAFQPKIRIFSTLGQPNWLAAYLAILLPLLLAYMINRLHPSTHQIQIAGLTTHITQRNLLIAGGLFLLAILFYVDIIYTGSQSGFLGTVVALGIFILGYLFLQWKERKQSVKIAGGIIGVMVLITFFLGVPISQLNRFTFPELQKSFQAKTQPSQNTATPSQVQQTGTALEGTIAGGIDSGTIRTNVWNGAIDMWKDHPLFGTGVETFAFAYYGYRPASHNMTSEWDYLYNKAHNEYLNYLATSGIFGLGSYLLIIGVFLWLAVKHILQKTHENKKITLLLLALLAGYSSMLVSNFFGFSVVIVNVYLFLIPALFFLLADKLTPGKAILPSFAHKTVTHTPPSTKKSEEGINSIQWISIVVVFGIALFQIWTLTSFWVADQAFALAQNLNRVGQYNDGAVKIREAIALRNDEPVFREELATSDATIAVALAQQKQEETAKQLATEAVTTITSLTTQYPRNINFLKSQVRIYYTLSQLDPSYLQPSLETMKRLEQLAPTDAKISYNLGVLYGQTGNTKKGIETLEKTIKLKPDYRDAYFALGLFYRDLAVEPNSTQVTNPEMQEKAVEYMGKTLQFNKNDKAVLDTLKSWGER